MNKLRWLFIAFFALAIVLMFVAGCIGIRYTPTTVIPGPTPAGGVAIPRPLEPGQSFASVPIEEQFVVITNRPVRPPTGIHLEWVTAEDPKTIAGFKIHMGFTSEKWEQIIPVANTNQDRAPPVTNVVNITNLRSHPYVFAVAAIDTNGIMGPLSQIDTWNLSNTNGTLSVSNGNVHLYLLAATNLSYKIEKSSNLSGWNLLTNASNLSGVVSFFIGTNAGKGYQRITVK